MSHMASNVLSRVVNLMRSLGLTLRQAHQGFEVPFRSLPVHAHSLVHLQQPSFCAALLQRARWRLEDTSNSQHYGFPFSQNLSTSPRDGLRLFIQLCEAPSERPHIRGALPTS